MPICSEIFGILIIIPGHFYSYLFKLRGWFLCMEKAFFEDLLHGFMA